jgi:hypothetical protein
MNIKGHRYPATTWNKAKSEAIDVMIAKAKGRAFVTYSDLAREIHAIHFDVQSQIDRSDIGTLLGEISTAESKAKRGMLSAIVVHKHGDMEPGPGFFELASDMGHSVPDKTKFWIEQVKKVHDYWANRAPEKPIWMTR